MLLPDGVSSVLQRFPIPLPLPNREEAPESFHHELENVAWEDSLRGCAENTYLVLFEVRAGPGWLAPLRCWAAPACSAAVHAFTMHSCATYTTQPVPHVSYPTAGQPRGCGPCGGAAAEGGQ